MKVTYRIGIRCLVLGIGLVSCKQQDKTSPVKRNIEEAVFANGSVTQKEEYLLSANTDGFIQDITIEEGDSVRVNELLVRINSDASEAQLDEAQKVYSDARRNISSASPQLSQIKIQIDQVQEQVILDKKNYNRYVQLRLLNSVSQLELEKAELQYKNSLSTLQALEKNLIEVRNTLQLNEERSLSQMRFLQIARDYSLLKSERNGVVLNVYKKRGELIKKGEVIAKIGSGAIVLKMFVAEEDISKIALGQQAKIQLNTYPEDIFDATVTNILPAFDETEQSYVVEARLKNAPEKLFSGTQLQANILVINRRDGLVIPTSYLLKEKYVLLDNGQQKQIVVGNKNKEWVEVLSGLTEKDVIVAPK